MIISQPHLCPRCRIELPEWKVKGSRLKKKIRPGDPWPMLEPFRSVATDKCSSCKAKLEGQINVVIDEDGEPEKLSHVKEVTDG